MGEGRQEQVKDFRSYLKDKKTAASIPQPTRAGVSDGKQSWIWSRASAGVRVRDLDGTDCQVTLFKNGQQVDQYVCGFDYAGQQVEDFTDERVYVLRVKPFSGEGEPWEVPYEKLLSGA